MKKHEKLRKQRRSGVTLIALIVTIIVLLILAGVTVATLTGDNGLLQKTENSKGDKIKAEGLEKIGVEIFGSYNNEGRIDTNELKKIFKILVE